MIVTNPINEYFSKKKKRKKRKKNERKKKKGQNFTIVHRSRAVGVSLPGNAGGAWQN